MNNQFRNELLIMLDNKYDGVDYNLNDNILKITINKMEYGKDLDEIIKDLSKEIMYPFLNFHSGTYTYTFTYKLRQE